MAQACTRGDYGGHGDPCIHDGCRIHGGGGGCRIHGGGGGCRIHGGGGSHIHGGGCRTRGGDVRICHDVH